MNSVQNIEQPDTDTRQPRQRRQRGVKGRAKGVKPEERGTRMSGKILRILYGQSYGLIRIQDRRDVFFHRKDARASLFNALEPGDRVIFELIEDPLTGPRAIRVARAA
jgi:cold shock CspA family protein